MQGNPFIAYLNRYTTISSKHEAALVGNDGEWGTKVLTLVEQ